METLPDFFALAIIWLVICKKEWAMNETVRNILWRICGGKTRAYWIEVWEHSNRGFKEIVFRLPGIYKKDPGILQKIKDGEEKVARLRRWDKIFFGK